MHLFDNTGGMNLDQVVRWVNRIRQSGAGGGGLSGAVIVGGHVGVDVVRELDISGCVAWR